MIKTVDDVITGTGTTTGPGNSRCMWDDAVCVDLPTHFINHQQDEGTSAELFCVRHYVLTLARLCQLHLPDCPGPFDGHVAGHGEL